MIGTIFIGLFIVTLLGFLGLPKGSKLYQYCKNVLITYDQGFNVIVLLGSPDETVSSRAGKGRLRGSKAWTILANILDKIDPGHSEAAIEWDEGTTSLNDTLRDPTNKHNPKET